MRGHELRPKRIALGPGDELSMGMAAPLDDLMAHSDKLSFLELLQDPRGYSLGFGREPPTMAHEFSLEN